MEGPDHHPMGWLGRGLEMTGPCHAGWGWYGDPGALVAVPFLVGQSGLPRL